MQICDGTVALFLDGRVTLVLLPGFYGVTGGVFDVLQGALERGWFVLSSPILSGLFSLLPFPFSSALLARCLVEANSRDAALMEGRTPGVLPRRVSPSAREISLLQQDCFSGGRGRAQSACKCACWRGENQTVAFSRANFLQEQGRREVVPQIGASPANCIDKIMKVFVCTCSCCV